MERLDTLEQNERLERPLIRLAHHYGISTAYQGFNGETIEVSDEIIVAVLSAMGVYVADDMQADHALHNAEEEFWNSVCEPTILHILGRHDYVEIRHSITDIPKATLHLEDGAEYGILHNEALPAPQIHQSEHGLIVTSALAIPNDIPIGYHTLTITIGRRTVTTTLIVAPKAIPTIEALQHQRLWGWMAQLYSIRSHSSWGVGDFEDLRCMLRESRRLTGADFVQINPLHAAEPVAPLTPSPYLPSSRSVVNFTYIRPENIEEYGNLSLEQRQLVEELHRKAALLNDVAEEIDRNQMWQYKLPALKCIYRAGREPLREYQFQTFKERHGDMVKAYAVWCLAYEKWGEPTDEPDSWIHRYNRDSREVDILCREFADDLEFYYWLCWIADEQLATAQQDARAVGMPIGILADLAVGVHPCGADVWWNPERYAKGATVGAPPDAYSQLGQDWSQPPLLPQYLHNNAYLPFREQIHAMLAHAGALRIDHILGLFRLWWIPQGKTPKFGTYVHYRSDILLSILAIEATRAHAVIIGEDLGVVPDYVAGALRKRQVFGSVVELFEQRNGEFIMPQHYRSVALASVVTHDMPPIAGYLESQQVSLRACLHLLDDPEQAYLNAQRELRALQQMLERGGYLDVRDDSLSSDVAAQLLIEAMHKALVDSPSQLLCAALVDAVGEWRTQNLPGTNDEYPNWKIPLANRNSLLYLDDIFSMDRVQSLASIMNTVHERQ